MNSEKRRRTGVLIALGLLAVSVVVSYALTDATSALACCGGGGW